VILEKLTLLNYKNIAETTLQLSPKINCFIGHNGAGKTNVLDAVYYLSFCHSVSNPSDSQVIRHGQELMMLEGRYAHDLQRVTAQEAADSGILISIGMKVGQKKHVKRNKKEYKRLSEHIGLIPIVMIAPQDVYLIAGGSEERRRLMDVVIAQMNRSYMDSLTRYNKALQQRNSLLKQEAEPDVDVISIFEEQMAASGEEIFRQRTMLAENLTPLFQHYYEQISGGSEQVSLQYTSHCQRGPLLDVIQRDRRKDRAVGYSLHGVHRDDLEIMLDGHPMKREGSQGQQKTFVTSLKLAQFELLRRAIGDTPILLLDDIFDKLDALRVEKIVDLVQGDSFGQIFMTDTNREHLDSILTATAHDYRIFEVCEGELKVKSEE
jgi:DNA replication and repair protein RecF